MALPEVRRPRQQPRLLHADAGRDAGRQPPAVSRSGCRRSSTTSIRARGRRGFSCRRFPTRSTPTSIRRSCAASIWSAARCSDRFEREGKDGVISRYSVLDLVQRFGPHDELFPQHHRHPDGDRPRLGHAVHVRPRRFPADALERRVHARADATYPNPWKGGTLHLPTPSITCSRARWASSTLRRSGASSSSTASTRSARGRSPRAGPKRLWPTSFPPRSTTCRRAWRSSTR